MTQSQLTNATEWIRRQLTLTDESFGNSQTESVFLTYVQQVKFDPFQLLHIKSRCETSNNDERRQFQSNIASIKLRMMILVSGCNRSNVDVYFPSPLQLLLRSPPSAAVTVAEAETVTVTDPNPSTASDTHSHSHAKVFADLSAYDHHSHNNILPHAARMSSLAYEFRILSHLHHHSCEHVPGFAIYYLNFDTGQEQLLEPVMEPMDTMKLLPFDQLALILSHLPKALNSLHASGIVHADLKPSHICWNQSQQRVELMDFDLAYPLATLDALPPFDGLDRNSVATTKSSNATSDANSSIAFRGNVSYASLRVHYGMQCSPFSDCESAIYICLETLVQQRFPTFQLPWIVADDDQTVENPTNPSIAASEQLLLLQPSPSSDEAAFEELSKWLNEHTGMSAVNCAADSKLRYLMDEELTSKGGQQPSEATAFFLKLFAIARPRILALLMQPINSNTSTTRSPNASSSSSSSQPASRKLQSSSQATDLLQETIALLLSTCNPLKASDNIDQNSQPNIIPRGLSSSDIQLIESKLAATIDWNSLDKASNLDGSSTILAAATIREPAEASHLLLLQHDSTLSTASLAPSLSESYCAFELRLEEQLPFLDESDEPEMSLEQLPLFFPSLWAQAQQAEQLLLERLQHESPCSESSSQQPQSSTNSRPSPFQLLVNPIVVCWLLPVGDRSMRAALRFFQALSKASDIVKQRLFPLLSMNVKLKRVLVLCTEAQLHADDDPTAADEESFDASAVALLHQVASAAAAADNHNVNEDAAVEEMEENEVGEQEERDTIAAERTDAAEPPRKRVRR